MKKVIGIVVLLVIAGASWYVYTSGQPTRVSEPLAMPETGEVRVENVAPLFYDGLPSDYAIVDVRTKAEYEKEYTEGTINVPVAIFEDADEPCKEIISKLPTDKKIIFICPFGPRSKEMYGNLTDSEEDLGCGMKKEGVYHLWARVKYKKDRLVVQRQK
ncbi:MAG: hypothetical protein C0603_10910 [Denitrovibrio sp.]|nr:MAG: hypothetical protein C0603_10910 [Denitrovibrio sp.]